LAEARRTAERVGALADQLVALYPEQPAAHMMRTEAFIHKSKTAWQDNDRAIVERAERQALDAARHALALDPRSEGARLLVKDGERRVARIQIK
jgi:hypothetical protein